MDTQSVKNFAKLGRKILCAGVNYRQFARQIGGEPAEPIVFLKPTTAYAVEGQQLEIPYGKKEVHYEVELGIVIGKRGKSIPVSEAMEYIGGYCVALDMTDLKLLNELKEKNLPIALAKGFDTSCAVGNWIPVIKVKDPQNMNIWLKVNGDMKQNSNTNDMIFSIPYLVSWMSNYFTLEPGDLILTGTPPGLGPAKGGDIIECGLGDVAKVTFQVKQKSML